MCGYSTELIFFICSMFPTIISFDFALEKATFILFGLYKNSAISVI